MLRWSRGRGAREAPGPPVRAPRSRVASPQPRAAAAGPTPHLCTRGPSMTHTHSGHSHAFQSSASSNPPEAALDVGSPNVVPLHRAVPATSRINMGPDNRAGSLEVLQRADCTVTTTMQLSPRRPAFRAVHLFVTVSIGRKVWLFAKQSN